MHPHTWAAFADKMWEFRTFYKYLQIKTSKNVQWKSSLSKINVFIWNYFQECNPILNRKKWKHLIVFQNYSISKVNELLKIDISK